MEDGFASFVPELPMNYWLMKSEPSSFSLDDLKCRPNSTEHWDGVRNYQARNFMRAMKKGDLAFFYHSGSEKACVGIVKVVAEAHPDSTDGQWECVDVAAVAALPRPVTLAEIKATPQLKEMVLVRNSRLSVQPVTASEWGKVCTLGGLEDPPTA